VAADIDDQRTGRHERGDRCAMQGAMLEKFPAHFGFVRGIARHPQGQPNPVRGFPMSSFRLPRHAAIALSASVCLAAPAFAESPTTVTFQPHTPWTQEVNSVTHDDNYHDYTVAVEAGKTLQINLYSKNPNLFFKVTNDTLDKQLVDTYETGATTWSTSTAAPATYSIHVYAVREAIPHNETAKYDLQVGQYSPQDTQPAASSTQATPAAAAKPATASSSSSP
jgi:hypothetical protein